MLNVHTVHTHTHTHTHTVGLQKLSWACVCVCVCERESEWARERERERVCVCVWERECVCVFSMYIEYCCSVGSFGEIFYFWYLYFLKHQYFYLIRMNLYFIKFTRCYNLYLCWSIMNNRKNVTAAKMWVAPPLCVAPPPFAWPLP